MCAAMWIQTTTASLAGLVAHVLWRTLNGEQPSPSDTLHSLLSSLSDSDFGFERIFLNSPCTPMPDFLWPPPQPSDCQEGDNYTISSGYCLTKSNTLFPPPLASVKREM